MPSGALMETFVREEPDDEEDEQDEGDNDNKEDEDDEDDDEGYSEWPSIESRLSFSMLEASWLTVQI
jgi:hypothetical protein